MQPQTGPGQNSFLHFSSFWLSLHSSFFIIYFIIFIFLSFQVSFFNHLFYHVFSFFVIFASSGAKIFQKMESCNFPRFFHVFLSMFSCFYHCSFIFHNFCFQWCNNFPKNGKLQFPRAKMMKKLKNDKKKTRKIAVFHFSENFCTTGSKNDKKMIKHDKTMINK